MTRADQKLCELERHWQIALPDDFRRLYHAFEHPFVSPCEFLSLTEMEADTERWHGMLPQFMPFGHDGAEDGYGFYIPSFTSHDDYPVLFWDHEYDHYVPIASGFRAFLRWCFISGRYLAQDAIGPDNSDIEDEEFQRQEFARIVGLPRSAAVDTLPRNDRELYERLAAADPQGAQAMVQLGTTFLGRPDPERALDFFARASESTPWFADPYYMMAETYRRQGNIEGAIQRWWHVLHCPIALSTRTPNYDLGEDHVEAEIAEATVEQLKAHSKAVPAGMRGSMLGRLIFERDAFAPTERTALSDRLAAEGDLAGQERELLNAITLATSLVDTDDAYDRLIALYDKTNRPREAAFCRTDRTKFEG